MQHNHTVIKVTAVKREKNDDCHNCCCFTLCVANLYKKAASNWRMACVNKLQITIPAKDYNKYIQIFSLYYIYRTDHEHGLQ